MPQDIYHRKLIHFITDLVEELNNEVDGEYLSHLAERYNVDLKELQVPAQFEEDEE
jgi:hypothetical protein